MKNQELMPLFWSTLFDNDDRTCFAMNCPFMDPPGPREVGLSFVDIPKARTREYFVINAMHTSRHRENVTKYRTFLVELDHHTLDEQERIMRDSGIPYSAKVFSGGKSYHYTISLSVPLATEEEYNAVAKRIYLCLGIRRMREDQGNKNPTRFSRTPGALRGAVVGTRYVSEGREQELMEVRGRVDNDVLFAWLEEKTKSLPFEDAVDAFGYDSVFNFRLNEEHIDGEEADDDYKWEWVMKHCVREEELLVNRHQFLFRVASVANKVGIDSDRCKSFMCGAWNGHRSTKRNSDGTETVRTITEAEIGKQVDDTYRRNRGEHGATFIRKSSRKEMMARRDAEFMERFNRAKNK